MPSVMMKCGCRASARGPGNKPVCAIHYLTTEDATIVAETPDLEGRKAYCMYCGAEQPSSIDLPFFEYAPKHTTRPGTDRYYCGCRGWD